MVAMASLNCFDGPCACKQSRKPVQLLAFNGGGYSIAKWLPPVAKEIWRWNWNFYHAMRFADAMDRMSVGVGFSRGATALGHMPAFTDYFTDVFLHSPAFDQPIVNTACRYHLFVTYGDTTPVRKDATKLFDWLASHGATTTLHLLPFVEFDRPTLFERYLSRKQHIFHNVVPVLKSCDITKPFFEV
jgi:hypothetical protein